jgi:hypothetical protein
VKRGTELEGERAELLRGERAEPPEKTREPRALEKLEHEVGSRPVQHGLEAPQQTGVLQPLQNAGLPSQAIECCAAGNALRTEHLGDHETVKIVVPRQIRLVASAASQGADGL